MDRRTLLGSLAASILAGTVRGGSAQISTDTWQTQFAAALQRNPKLLGFASASQPRVIETRLRVDGQLPPGLTGVFYRNGPARHDIGDMRYHHWFDGDGMVHAFRFSDGGVTHQSRFVETAKFRREQEAGRALYPGFGTTFDGHEPVTQADDVNVANINIIDHGGDLLALWEGGSAYRLDPQTLETLGIKTWDASTAGAPFGSHPRVDAQGVLWNIGYAPTAGAIVLYRIAANGGLDQAAVIRHAPMAMIHDFMVTERHLVIWLSPFLYQGDSDGAFLDRFAWQPDQGSRILVVDKNRMEVTAEIEAPPSWIFHFSNAYEDPDGVIEFDAPMHDDPGIMTQSFRDVMRGVLTPAPRSQLARIRLDVSGGRLDVDPLSDSDGTEFPRIDPRLDTRRHRNVFAMQNRDQGPLPAFDTLVRFDRETGDSDRFTFPAAELAEEHVFAVDADSAQPGWLIGTSLDTVGRETVLNIFPADNIAGGPVARARIGLPIPLGLHGNYVSA